MTVLTHPAAVRSPATVDAYASGPLPYRALLIGGRVLDGHADDGHLVLADAFAEALAVSTGHGVDVEASLTSAALSHAGALLPEDRDITRTDALVLVLQPTRDDLRGSEAKDRVARMLAELAGRLTVASPLVVVVPSPLATELSPRELDEFARIVDEAADALTRVVRLHDGDRDLSAPARTALWASQIADVTAGALTEPMVRFLPHDPFDEELRVDAVDRVGTGWADWMDTFQTDVDSARTAYGTPSAAMSLIDDETTRYFARSGNVAVSLPRGKTVCNRVMRIYGGLILGDARLDHRFEGLPEVRTGDVRFYAGYRILGPNGAPFGALCVFDSAPRTVQEEDLTALRDLALAAQRRLWQLLPPVHAG